MILKEKLLLWQGWKLKLMSSKYLLQKIHCVNALGRKKVFHRLTHQNISTRASISSNLFPTCCLSSPSSNLGTAACLVEKRSVTDLSEDWVLCGKWEGLPVGDWQCDAMTPFNSRLAHGGRVLHALHLFLYRFPSLL